MESEWPALRMQKAPLLTLMQMWSLNLLRKNQKLSVKEGHRSRAAKLHSLMLMDTTEWSHIKMEIHQKDIRQPSAKVNEDKAHAEQRQMTARTKSSSKAQTKVPRAPPTSDVHSRRFFYARAKLDAEFDKKINSSVSKWSMVAEAFNKGFVLTKDKES